MKIYIDSDFKCHVSPAEGCREINGEFFEGKCEEFIEGYRLVPHAETWTREDGTVFQGEMTAPFRNYEVLAAMQSQYEKYKGVSDGELTESVEAIL